MRGTILLAIGTGIANIAALIFFSRKLSNVMSAQERLNQIIQGLNQATNEIAARIHEALQTLKDGQVTPDSLGTLEAVVGQLRAMGQSTADPLPGTIPVGNDLGKSIDLGSSTGTGTGSGSGTNAGSGAQTGTDTGLQGTEAGDQGDGGAPGTDTAGAPIGTSEGAGTGSQDLSDGTDAGTGEGGEG